MYRKPLKNWNLARWLRKFFCLERATVVRAQGASEDKKFAAKPTKPDSNFSKAFGIDPACDGVQSNGRCRGMAGRLNARAYEIELKCIRKTGVDHGKLISAKGLIGDKYCAARFGCHCEPGHNRIFRVRPLEQSALHFHGYRDKDNGKMEHFIWKICFLPKDTCCLRFIAAAV